MLPVRPVYRSVPSAQNKTTKAAEHVAVNSVTAPVEIAVNKAVVEVVFHVNAEETHDESDKGNVAQAVPNDATADTANDTTQEAQQFLAFWNLSIIKFKQMFLILFQFLPFS